MRALALSTIGGAALGALLTWYALSGHQAAAIATLKREQTEQTLRNSAAALEAYSRMEKTKNEAIEAAEVLASKNRADADAASRALVGLRGELSRVPARIESASRAAITEYATTATVVFEQCARRYTEVAGDADGHAVDAIKLENAWPRTISPYDTGGLASRRQPQ